MAVAGLLVLGLAIGAGVVVAQQTSVTTYTGCLAMAGGTITLLAPGSSPLKPCGPGSVQIRLGGGDITSVNPGTGLTGGGTEGDVSLAVAPSYQLPQTCASGAITTWNGTTWGCGTDTNTTYSAGTGLDLNGTTFSVEPTYRLPQGCASNEIAKVSSGFWTCAADQIGTSTLPGVFYTSYPDNTDFGFLPGNAQEHPIISLAVPAGNYLVQAPVEIHADDTEANALCFLNAGSTRLWLGQIWLDEERTGFIMLVAPASLPIGGTFSVTCKAGNENRGVTVRAAIAALQVGTVQVLPRQ